MAEAIGFHSPAVYVPQSSTVPQKLFGDVTKEDSAPATPDTGQTADPTTAAQVPVVGTTSQNFDGSNSQSGDSLLPDQSTQFAAQELGAQQDPPPSPLPPVVIKTVLTVPGPNVLVGTPDALQRFDGDTDGHINQSEAQRAVLADSGTTTYAALTQYQRAIDLAPEPVIPVPKTGSNVSQSA